MGYHIPPKNHRKSWWNGTEGFNQVLPHYWASMSRNLTRKISQKNLQRAAVQESGASRGNHVKPTLKITSQSYWGLKRNPSIGLPLYRETPVSQTEPIRVFSQPRTPVGQLVPHIPEISVAMLYQQNSANLSISGGNTLVIYRRYPPRYEMDHAE